MPSTLYVLIFKLLLQHEHTISSAVLADRCNVSIKTINNSMPSVKKLAKEYHLNFVAQRGKGYLIDNDMTLKSAIQSRVQDEPVIFYEQDRLLYILHCLLNCDEPCRIKNLEYTLHLTRPSIYKLLDKIKAWLKPLNIKLERTRKEGLRIVCGEKRHRLAAAQWYNETVRYLKNQAADYCDALHLNECLNTYLQTYQKEIFNSLIREIQNRYDFEFLKYDLEQVAIMLHISIQRILCGFTVSFPDSYVGLIKKVGLESYVHEIAEIIETRFQLKLPEAEAYYLFSIIFSSETYNDKKMIQQQKARIQINAELKRQILDLYKNSFTEDEQKALIDDIEASLKNEIIYQVKKAVPNASEFCERVQQRYPSQFKQAGSVYTLIQEYYPLKYVLKFHCLLTMILAYHLEKAKQRVTIALVYNCGNAEKHYMLYMLQKYVPDGKVIHECQYNSLMAQDCLQTDCDLMISTLSLNQLTDDYLLLPLTFSFEDLQYVEKKVHQLYIQKNKE